MHEEFVSRRHARDVCSKAQGSVIWQQGIYKCYLAAGGREEEFVSRQSFPVP